MLKSTKGLPKALGAILVAPFLVVLPVSSLADSGVNDELGGCAAVSDAPARLACYDGLADRQEVTPPATIAVPAEAPPAVIAAPAEASPSVAPPDELGSGSVRSKDGTREEDAPVAARVIRCVKDANKDYVFYLDGGQVWKQTNDKKLSYKTCDFNVAISKDVFGYRMQVDGESRKIRVARIR